MTGTTAHHVDRWPRVAAWIRGILWIGGAVCLPVLVCALAVSVLAVSVLAVRANAQAPDASTPALIPHPLSISLPDAGNGAPFLLDSRTPVRVHVSPASTPGDPDGGDAEAASDARELERLATWLRDHLGHRPPANGQAPAVHLELIAEQALQEALFEAGDGLGPSPGVGDAAIRSTEHLDEAYLLDIDQEAIRIRAARPAGLFYGLQTLRQWLPADLERSGIPGNVVLEVPPVSIVDAPRFSWRGSMLDVARHFFGVEDVSRYVDLMALYKLNRLHLHLSDDQGWRVDIPGRPALVRVGAQTAVGGGPGGYYTTSDYEYIVRYAAERFITIVPEIDMPGHTNAALASIPELNCDGQARPLYTGMNVGFSTLCVDREETYEFVEDVVREIAERTPGAWFHVGGDEVQKLSPEEYRRFMLRIQPIVARHGKQFLAWDEVAEVGLPLPDGALVQVWRPQTAETGRHLRAAYARGARFILSPANHIYLDMKYDADSRIGLTWAGPTSIRKAYEWDPATLVAGIPESAIEGIEAPLWTETAESMADLEWLAFPRLVGVADLGWAARNHLGWESYALRLAAHTARWRALNINYYPLP